MKKYLILIVLAFTLACNAYKDINVSSLNIGMSKPNVENLLKRNLVLVSNSINADQKKQEVYQVQKRIVRGGIARQQRYNLFFVDNKLVRYELADEKFSF